MRARLAYATWRPEPAGGEGITLSLLCSLHHILASRRPQSTGEDRAGSSVIRIHRVQTTPSFCTYTRRLLTSLRDPCLVRDREGKASSRRTAGLTAMSAMSRKHTIRAWTHALIAAAVTSSPASSATPSATSCRVPRDVCPLLGDLSHEIRQYQQSRSEGRRYAP